MGKYALLIGVETYGQGLPALPAAPKDVAALREVLLNLQIGAFDEARSLINPTQPEMAKEIELWFQDRHPEDILLLFFSGHGVKTERRDLYFAAANTEKQRNRLLTSTAISARFIHDCIRHCRARRRVLIFDCCFSGAFGDLIGRDSGEINIKENLATKGCAVLTSTSAVDYSFEEKGANLSIYTRYLVEGLATGAADENGDGAITVDELHQYVSRKVKESSPVMSPTLITLEDEGFRIQIAQSHNSRHNSNHQRQQVFDINRSQSGQDELRSERFGINYYSNLKNLLANQDWKGADSETDRCMRKVMDCKGPLQSLDLEKFPSRDLLNIDRLWIKYSEGKFGFSIQKEIYFQCGGKRNGHYPGDKVWNRFGDRVGWRVKRNLLYQGWLSYKDATFALSAPKGHLPWKVCDSVNEQGDKLRYVGGFGPVPGKWSRLELFTRSYV